MINLISFYIWNLNFNFFFMFFILAASCFFPLLNFCAFRKTISLNFVLFSLFSVLLVTPIFLFYTKNLLLFYILLEIITFSFLLLIALTRKTSALISAIQYLIYNTVASSFFLLGIIIIYIYTFSLNLEDVSSFFLNTNFGLLGYISSINKDFGINFFQLSALPHAKIFVFGEFLILFSLVWKLAVFPLHFWVVNFYENIPYYLMAISSTILIFWYFLFFFYLLKYFLFLDKTIFLNFFLIISTIGSVFFGSIGLIDQVNIKRFLAFSSIFNVGFLLIASTYINSQVLSYIFLYCLSNIILFFIFIYLNSYCLMSVNYFTDLKFLRHNLFLLFPFSIIFFNLAGLPPFPGFFIKYSILSSMFQEFDYLFFIIFFIVMLNTVATFGYLNFLKIVFFDVNTVFKKNPVETKVYNTHFLFSESSKITKSKNNSIVSVFSNFSFFNTISINSNFLMFLIWLYFIVFFIIFLFLFFFPKYLYLFGLLLSSNI